MSPTKVTEIRQPTGVDRRVDPHCRACKLPPPDGTIAADELWARSQAVGHPHKVFRKSPS